MAAQPQALAAPVSSPSSAGGDGPREAVYVYEAPVRIWHWVSMFAIFALIVTGYLIGSPPPTISGEASDAFLFGYIRGIHFIAGYVLAIGLVLRTYWAIVGNKHARQIYWVPFYKKEYITSLINQIKQYSFLTKEVTAHVGHNPLAQASMFGMFLTSTVFLVLTGFALYGEGAGIDSWQYAAFGWVLRLFGSSYWVHTLHHGAMWVMIIFIISHIYAASREDAVGKATVISAMFSGWRIFRK